MSLDEILVANVNKAISMSIERYGIDLVQEALNATMSTDSVLEICDGNGAVLTRLTALEFANVLDEFTAYITDKERQHNVDLQRCSEAINRVEQFMDQLIQKNMSDKLKEQHALGMQRLKELT